MLLDNTSSQVSVVSLNENSYKIGSEVGIVAATTGEMNLSEKVGNAVKDSFKFDDLDLDPVRVSSIRRELEKENHSGNIKLIVGSVGFFLTAIFIVTIPIFLKMMIEGYCMKQKLDRFEKDIKCYKTRLDLMERIDNMVETIIAHNSADMAQIYTHAKRELGQIESEIASKKDISTAEKKVYSLMLNIIGDLKARFEGSEKQLQSIKKYQAKLEEPTKEAEMTDKEKLALEKKKTVKKRMVQIQEKIFKTNIKHIVSHWEEVIKDVAKYESEIAASSNSDKANRMLYCLALKDQIDLFNSEVISILRQEEVTPKNLQETIEKLQEFEVSKINEQASSSGNQKEAIKSLLDKINLAKILFEQAKVSMRRLEEEEEASQDKKPEEMIKTLQDRYDSERTSLVTYWDNQAANLEASKKELLSNY